jgi:predicted DCC family thiol-disulfide oxidoreductase YuxK
MESAAIAPSLDVPRTQTIVLFDDKCPMCTFQSRLLTRLDWLHRIQFMPISDPRVPSLAPDVKHESLMASMHVLTPKGRIHNGARGVRYIAARLPLLWPVCLLLWIPGMIYISEIAYRTVARNRYLISKLFGCKTACAVLPEKR